MKKIFSACLAKLLFLIFIAFLFINYIDEIGAAIIRGIVGVFNAAIEGMKELYNENQTAFWVVILFIILLLGGSSKKK